MDVKNIKPYTDIWFDCIGNIYLSILQTINEKYKNIALNNEYCYHNKEEEVERGNYRFTMLRFYTTWSIVNKMMENNTNIDFTDEESFFKTVIGLMDKGKYVFVGVDLFYWIEQNICHGRNHWYHWSLVQKYDENNELFYVFDVDSDKYYGIFTIGKKEFLTAARMGLNNDVTSYYCDINSNAGARNITIGLLTGNALKLIKNVEDAGGSTYYHMADQDFRDYNYADLNQAHLARISQRHIANLSLFEEMHKRGFIDDDQGKQLSEMAKQLSSGWSILKNNVAMLYFRTNNSRKIDLVNVEMKLLFSMEKEMWELFCEAVAGFGKEDIVFEFD